MFRIKKTMKRKSKRLVHKPFCEKKMEDFESGFSFPEVIRVSYQDFILT